ncbi:unnamed protein product [Ceratitis capitata]|uniref:(Mediterranean fruit fly) hypothetical protein n=1 Tax=Ceratitis capitata TaxID=7213 RepID=A0A811U0G5_CERCA|nr:unnamed protein product [Ceratitis capitata]
MLRVDNNKQPSYILVLPSKPLNLTVLNVTSTSITMSWYPPKNQNGAIAGYHVFHIHENQTGVEIMKNSRNSQDSIIIFELPNLTEAEYNSALF